MLPQTRFFKNPILLGLIFGWLAGVLWWSGLMIAFGPSTRTIQAGGQWNEEQITVASRLVYGPLMAIPWAVVGLIVGIVNMAFRGYCLPMMAVLGTIGGGVYSLTTRPFDGWLALTMPIDCFVGSFLGSVIGIALAASSRLRSSDGGGPDRRVWLIDSPLG